MKYIDEFRQRNLVERAARSIKVLAPKDNINIMEVCGTHTQNFYRFGLHKLLPKNIRLIAGPGCPVCVSHSSYIDQAIRLAQDKRNIILTFGDMLTVPGSKATLEKQRAKSGNILVVYSSWDSLKIAEKNPDKKVILLAVGFETTIPTIALAILSAKKKKIKNLFFFSSLKLIPAAMAYLIQDKRLNLQGFLCPGHVSAIIGTKPYIFIPKKYGIGCCITGFEPLDILEGIYILIRQIVKDKPKVENQYLRVVPKEGNLRAQKIISEVFKISDASWRGLGKIPHSGLKIRNEFSQFDAEREFSLKPKSSSLQPKTQCRCGEILKGLISPLDCPLFAKACLPDNPIGPCMVSREGACNAYYKYRRVI